MEETLKLRLISVAEIFLVSWIGFITPVRLAGIGLCVERGSPDENKSTFLDSNAFKIIKTFSAGVILGVALLHLLADAVSTLQEYSSYPVCLSLVALGIILTLCFEQITAHVMHYIKCPPVSERRESRVSGDRESICGQCTPATVTSKLEPEKVRSYSATDETVDAVVRTTTTTATTCNSLDENFNNRVSMDGNNPSLKENSEFSFAGAVKEVTADDLRLLTNKSEQHRAMMRSIVKAIVLETSVAVHSIIIGFGLGTMSSERELPTIRILMAALAFHQFFEGISLGTAISETNLKSSYILTFSIVFSLTLPTGVLVGIVTENSAAGEYISGCANSVAAGSLIYSCLVEMVAEDFSDPDLGGEHLLKAEMILSFALGVGFMAVLAIWG